MGKNWVAKWIMDKRYHELTPLDVFHKEMDVKALQPHREDLRNQHMLVRKKFNLKNKINKAHVNISADDYYKLYINGCFAGQGPAPGYYFHYYYNRLDISKYLLQGENIISVHVYYQGLINRVWNSGDYRQGMIAEVVVNDKVEAATDKTWKYTIAKEYVGQETTGYKTQYIENIDSRNKEQDWQAAVYDDSKWENAVENIKDDHKLFLQQTDTLDVYEIQPEIRKEINKGHYFIDFGHEITGNIKMKAKGISGQVIEIRYGEELEEDNREAVRYDMRCNCRYREHWILSGREDVFEPYDYKAFRFAEVIAPEGVVNDVSITGVVRHYPFDESKHCFNSSDEVLNQIWNICKNGVIYGTQEVFVDCPSREKGQYLGDFTVSGLSQVYLSGKTEMYKKALEDFSLSSYICPGLMAVAPGSFMQEIADYSLQWPQNLLTYYVHSGDIAFLEKMYTRAKQCVGYFDHYKREDELLENVTEKWNLVDWPENYRDEYDFNLKKPVGQGCHNVINAFYIGAVQALSKISGILGKSDVKFKSQIERLVHSYQRVFFNTEEKLFIDAEGSSHSSLHANIIPLYYHIIPDGSVKSIVDLIRKKRFSCGVYNAFFLLKGLASIGEHELVYSLLRSEEERSWCNMLREGATTCFEAWGKNQKWNTSLCHPWASAPVSVLVEDIAGLKPLKPGWEEIGFSPAIPEQIKHFYLMINVRTGKIEVELKDGELTINGPTGIDIHFL